MSDFTAEERNPLSPRTRKSNPVFQSPHFKHAMLNDEEVEVKLAAAGDYDSDKSKANAAARFFSTVRSNTSKNKYVTIGAAAVVLVVVLSAGGSAVAKKKVSKVEVEMAEAFPISKSSKSTNSKAGKGPKSGTPAPSNRTRLLLHDEDEEKLEETWLEMTNELILDLEVVEQNEETHRTLRECDIPEDTVTWKYYDSLIDSNRQTAALARSLEEYVPEPVSSGEEDSCPIPRRLIFTHKLNLLDCDVSSSINTDPGYHTLAHNVHDTINAYKKVWAAEEDDDDIDVTFLTDEDCVEAISEVEPELLKYYDGLEGMFKGDVCRIAYLYKYGG